MKKDEIDYSKLKRRTPRPADPEAGKSMISLRVEGTLLADIKKEAYRLGIPYQTLISSILFRYVEGDLIDKKEAFKISKGA